MIKLPEPVAWITMGEVSFKPPTCDHDAYRPYYTEAQLKQAVRDALEHCAALCARNAQNTSADEIRALIKEIPE